ncbi:kinase-like protein [Microthyrium microscopicum]|uniref:non-specific serine/threonine protein kinase n=1 Tax=Microthyrium microscopicum TaxID=703497 RepID=A0A6A6UTC8_9PEZI|nr:kinase-like protein [Microthyrium microscopicum]
MASVLLDVFYSISSCLVCFPSSPQLRINSRSFKILRLLGEGGFSYVYLVEDTSTHALYALKKIRCPFGQESVSHALKEVEAYKLFTPNPNIIPSIDHSVASDKNDPGAKTVYVLLPYYRRGNLQDVINANLVNHTKFPEKRLMKLMVGVCRALKAMHQYKVGGAPQSAQSARQVREQAARADRSAAEERHEDEDVEQPLMDSEVTRSQEGMRVGQQRAYAHRDIKPGNIMIDDDGLTPILMDLGSIAPSPTPITSRSQAIAVQDEAAEHSTMPYRAPELFDVKSDTTIDTKVDIWSVGCTLYACLVGKSPFEARSDETGGSLSLCVLGGDWRFPDEQLQAQSHGRQQKVAAEEAPKEDGVSAPVKDIVRKCLSVEPSERPDVDELMGLLEDAIEQLPDDITGD